MAWNLVLVVAATLAAVYLLQRRARGRRQQAFLDGYRFHPAIRTKLAERRPELSEQQIELVFQGLREYFQICRQAGRRMVSMPSQAVDDAWHEFILFTRSYQRFCRQGLGRFLHHTPAEAMHSPTQAQEGIKRAWQIACKREGIAPRSPNRLPLLFAIDGLLGIADGFHYSLDCQDPKSPFYGDGYCAAHIGCGSEAGSEGNDSGCGGDCGGGCGGD